MRTGRAIVALLATFIVANWMIMSPELRASGTAAGGSSTSLGQLLMFYGPSAVIAIAVPILLAVATHGRGWKSVSGLTLAVRASLAFGVVAILLYIAVTWWSHSAPEPELGVSRPLAHFFAAPFWAVLGGALFLESMRQARARKEAEVPDRAVSSGVLLAYVALSAFVLMMGTARF